MKLSTETWIKINLEPLNEVKHRDMDKNKPGAIECKLCTETWIKMPLFKNKQLYWIDFTNKNVPMKNVPMKNVPMKNVPMKNVPM